MNAELLGPPINFAVIQLPERKFPGVVVQGDTLWNLLRQVERANKYLNDGALKDASEEMNDVGVQLADALKYFEKICLERGIMLPY